MPTPTANAPQTAVVSVIILNYNGVANDHLPDCLASLAAQSHPALQIIVVDNASSDNSVDFIQSHYPHITLIQNQTNLGFCRGNNVGFAQATGEFLFFLNNDTLVQPDCIGQLLQAAAQYPQAGLFSPKLQRPLPPHSPPSAAPLIDSAGLLLRRDLTLRDRGFSTPDQGQFQQPAFLFAVCGAALFIRSSLAHALAVDGRLWDEAFFAYYEDGDLSWRAQNAGWRCLYWPTAVVIHKRGGASPASFFQKPAIYQLHTIKNRYLMLLKNGSWRLLWPQLPYILLRELLIWGYLALHPRRLWATLQALRPLVGLAWRQRAVPAHPPNPYQIELLVTDDR